MLRAGFIGLGAISNEHVLGYLDSDDAEIVAVCDTDQDVGRRWLERWKLPRAKFYRQYEDMLEQEALDIVEILTPHHLHCSQAVRCAEANVKGVSVQKPMAARLQECDRIIETCKRNNVRLRVYENFLFYPVYLQAKALIEQGLIGDLISIRVHTMAGIRDGAAWPLFWEPGSWRMDLGRAGVGPLVGDDGFHKFALARWFMGRDFEKISAWIDADTPLDAPALIRARFKGAEDGSKYAQIDFSFSRRMALPCDFWLDDFVEIFGEKGVMWINQCSGGGDREFFKDCEMSQSSAFPPIAVFVDGKVTTFLDDITPETGHWSTSFIDSTRHFIQVVKSGGTPIFTGEDGKEITRYLMAAYVSAQENRDVYLDEITTQAEENGEFGIKTNFCATS